jgi:hypothetical protein
VDLILIGIESMRETGLRKTIFAPYFLNDYKGIGEEYLVLRKRGRVPRANKCKTWIRTQETFSHVQKYSVSYCP